MVWPTLGLDYVYQSLAYFKKCICKFFIIALIKIDNKHKFMQMLLLSKNKQMIAITAIVFLNRERNKTKILTQHLYKIDT